MVRPKRFLQHPGNQVFGITFMLMLHYIMGLGKYYDGAHHLVLSISSMTPNVEIRAKDKTRNFNFLKIGSKTFN